MEKVEKRKERMKYDTAGNPIIEIIPNCSCGLTGGCEKCNPFLGKRVPTIEEIWKTTDKLPSLSRILSDNRDGLKKE